MRGSENMRKEMERIQSMRKPSVTSEEEKNIIIDIFQVNEMARHQNTLEQDKLFIAELSSGS